MFGVQKNYEGSQGKEGGEIMADWLEGLKAGDRVVVQQNYATSDACIKIVGHVTKTQIILDDGRRFRRSNGGMVGGHVRGAYLKMLTPEWAEIVERNRILSVITHAHWRNFSTDRLREVEGLIIAAQTAESNS